MNNIKSLVNKYIEPCHMMMLATVDGDQPWACTVYYVEDDDFNLYWASIPTRRHSQEITNNSKVSAAIPVKFVNGEKVIGIQVQGKASVVDDPKQVRPIVEKYAKKFGRTNRWVKDFTNLKTEHKLYKLTPSQFVLFDEENFSKNPRQEINS